MKAATVQNEVLIPVHVFQSTPPVKAATLHHPRFARASTISIHAAREGGDATVPSSKKQGLIFQSTPPVKAATRADIIRDFTERFQSTPPVKAATRTPLAAPHQYAISIHAAREGGDA